MKKMPNIFFQKEIKADNKGLTLGNLIAKIEKIGTKQNDGTDKYVRFDFGSAIPTSLASWRGDYANIALGYKLCGYDGDGKYGEANAEKLFAELKSAVGRNFTGWKGGEFTMNENTPIWVSNPGNASHTVIIDVLDNDYELILLTAYFDY